jgi:multimeric flavodoxin WrbA
MKEMFLKTLGDGHDITEFNLPKDLPVFCTGCKACFHQDISICPNKKYTIPIWDSFKNADVIVITSSVYVLHASAQVKAMLDHFGSKWLAHSPDKEMFLKKAVIITNCAGQGMKNVIKDIGASLDFWGIAKRYSIKQALFYTDWDKVDAKTKAKINKQCISVAKMIQEPVKKPRFKIRFLFNMMKLAHKKLIHDRLQKDGEPETKDYQYWKEQGWFDGNKPWDKNKA